MLDDSFNRRDQSEAAAAGSEAAIKGSGQDSDWRPGAACVVPGADPIALLLAASDQAFIACDREGIVRFWNAGAEALFGATSAEAAGRPAADRFAGGWPRRLRLDSPEPAKAAAEVLRPDGTRIPVELAAGAPDSRSGGLRLIAVRDLRTDAGLERALLESERRYRSVREELLSRMRLEDLIASLSTHFIHLPGERIDPGIRYALRSLGEFTEVDRVYILQLADDGGRVEGVFEWDARGIGPVREGCAEWRPDRLPWLFERMRSLRSIYLPSVDALPADAAAERAEFGNRGVKSLVMVPMVHRGGLRGCLGFETVRNRKEWPADHVQSLRMAAEIFVSALERKMVDQALREAKARYLDIFENAVEGIFQSTPEGRLLGANPALARIFGYADPAELIAGVGDIARDLYVDPGRRAEFLGALERQGVVTDFESPVKRKDGSVIIISENARAARRPDGSLEFCEGTVMDVTQRKRMEERLIHDALHDGLTGLPNRALLLERLGRALERARRRPGTLCAVLALDLDRFKLINDGMGHSHGDRFLVAFARRLEAILPAGTTLARLGGDEFCILLEEPATPDHAAALADRIQETLSRAFEVDGREVYAAASIGIAVGGELTPTPEELLREADTAMHRAKASGRGRYEKFDSSMHDRAVKIMTLENDLRRALERKEFLIHYQPIVSLADGNLTGFEALIRWNHPDLGLVPPNDFIPLAEETGLIVPIGRWVLEQSIRQLAEWQRVLTGGKRLAISVNLSGKQLQDAGLAGQIGAMLEEAGVAPSSLKLEVTESAIMESPEKAAAILEGLRSMGVQLSLDDFGTGYSSLSYLHRFPFHDLKIDRSFVSKLEKGDKDAEIVKVINELARNLGMDVVAEGIETEAQRSLLRELACRYGQGYLFSKPLERAAARKLIENGGLSGKD